MKESSQQAPKQPTGPHCGHSDASGHCAGKGSVGEFSERLRRKARKVTGARQAILTLLREQHHPMSAQEVFSALPSGNCDLATVYRSMHMLEGMAMVKRYDLGDGVARFELLGEGDDGHHHHLICIRCSGVVEIKGCLIAELEERIAAGNGFKHITHRLEFFGICPNCQ